MLISPARAVVFDILLRVEQEDAYASDLLRSTRCQELSLVDRRLATELVMGVLRWRALLDTRIRQFSSQRLDKLDPEVLTALRMAAYQIGWLDRIPAWAAIHESVELVKRARKRSAAPFANAVLRKLGQFAPNETLPTERIQSAASPQALAAASSHPEWLVQRWDARFGFEVARQICWYNQTPPRTAIRLRDTTAEEDLQPDLVELEPGVILADARRVVSGDITRTTAFKKGRLVIQDEASQLVAALVGSGNRILDCCAAPGGKTWALADRNPRSTIVAVEFNPHRAGALRQRIAAKNVQVITGNVCDLPVGEAFDRLLVDVPCSGTGTLARNPEIKWRLKLDDLTDLRSRQLAILKAAMKHAAPEGRVIYSTCSLELEEDEAVVSEALKGAEAFSLGSPRKELGRLRSEGTLVAANIDSLISGDFVRTIPGIHPCDGFFVAILEKQR